MLVPSDYIRYFINEVLTYIFTIYVKVFAFLNNLYFSTLRPKIDPSLFDTSTFKNHYPLVFVHGYLGIADLDFLGLEQYCLDYLKLKLGDKLVQAKIAPTASDDDRAVQLYYDLFGGDEVYRNITEYNGIPLKQPVLGRMYNAPKVPGWGLTTPVHFLCHSMGATTVGRLETIMRSKDLRTKYFGDDIPLELRNATDSSPWFKSIITLSGNCKGSTIMDLQTTNGNYRSNGLFVLLISSFLGFIYGLSTAYDAFRLLYDSKLDYLVKIDPTVLTFFAYSNKANLNSKRFAKNDLFFIENVNELKYDVNPNLYYLHCVGNDTVRLKNKKYDFIKNNGFQPFTTWSEALVGAHFPLMDLGYRIRQNDTIVPTISQKGYGFDSIWIKIKDMNIIREFYEEVDFEHPEIEIDTVSDLPSLMTNGTIQKGKQYFIQHDGYNHLNIILSYYSIDYLTNTPIFLSIVRTMYDIPA